AARATGQVRLADVGVARAAQFVPGGAAGGASEDVASDSVSALVERFLRGMMTFPGHGICFPQHGLYPAPRSSASSAMVEDTGDSDDDNVNDNGGSAMVAAAKDGTFAGTQDVCNSQILRILVHALHPAASKRMGDLAVDIMRVSPELIAPFWRSYHPTLDARLSLRYLGNMAFVTKVLGIPLPVVSEDDARAGEPPRLGTLVEHVYPQVLQRHVIGHGMQLRASPLVVYRNLLVVDVALRKLDAARTWIAGQMHRHAGVAARWGQLDRRLVALVAQRVPEAKVVLTMQRVLLAAFAEQRETAEADVIRELACREAVLRNVLIRVVGGYQRHFGSLLLEHGFEVGRQLADIRLAEYLAPPDASAPHGAGRNPLNAHMLLSLVRALSASNTRWLGRVDGLAGHTFLGTVAMLFLYAPQPAVRVAARAACLRALHSTALFDHDAREAACWLDAMALLVSPGALRGSRISEAPAEAVERAGELIKFFESAVVYAARQPDKYAASLRATSVSAEAAVSPLLAAVVEAAVLKMAAGSGTLATSMRGASVSAMAGAMHVHNAFAYVREVVCLLAQDDALKAEPLMAYLSQAAALVLAPRVDKAEALPEEQEHCRNVAAAFAVSVQGTRGYLALLGDADGSVEEETSAGVEELPDAVGRTLAREFSALCDDFEHRLDAFVDMLSAHIAAATASVSALTQWLLVHTQKQHGDARQMALI
ncbi:hypothetical protein GGI05_005136, partial [Coemansia sp. RSA 2603]